MGFRREIRQLITARAGSVSELSGSNGRPLQCAHRYHSKLEIYSTADNGIYLTDIEHLAHHLCHYQSPEEISLNLPENNQAICGLWNAIKKYNEEHDISLSDQQLLQLVAKTINSYPEFYGITVDNSLALQILTYIKLLTQAET